jgi:hypothetical protein
MALLDRVVDFRRRAEIISRDDEAFHALLTKERALGPKLSRPANAGRPGDTAIFSQGCAETAFNSFKPQNVINWVARSRWP